MKSPETNPAVDVVPDATPESVRDGVDSGGLGQLPIAVSQGDFSTPTKRTRTITRPRGLKTLEQQVTPPAETPPPPVAPLPVNLFSPAATPPLVAELPSQEQEAPRHEASVVDEFLAAPPTPEPEITETPAPLLTESPYRTDVLGGDRDLNLTINPETVSEPVSHLPSLALHDESVEPTLDSAAETVPSGEAWTELHDLSAVPDNLDPDARMVNDLLDQATAQILASTPSEAAVSDLAAAGAGDVPTRLDEHPGEFVVELTLSPSEIVDSGLSPLAQTLAHMAEAMHADLAIEETLDLDIADGPLLPLPTEAPTSASPPPHTPPPRTVPPPPPVVAGVPAAAPDARVAVDPLPGLPEALAERPRRPKRSKPWFEEVFDESYLRTLPFMTAEQTLQEVDFIESSLGVPRGSEILDVACGYGRHAIELVQRGLSVTGLDLSLPLLIRAADESQRRGVSVNFVHTDMREMSFERQFSGAYCMLTSFGYFDEESNLKVAEGIARALKPGGRFLIDVINRDYIVGDLPTRVWWEGDGCVVLEEVDFNFNTNRILTHRSVVFEDGQQLEQEISIRVYSLHELGKLLRQAGFRVIEVSGSVPTRGHFFGANSRNLLLLAERRSD